MYYYLVNKKNIDRPLDTHRVPSHSFPRFSLTPQNKYKNNISKILKINADEILFLFSWDVSRQ